MKAQKGYYSIVQYCPDLSRFEAANVGVLLFCPDSGFLKALLSSNNSRIIKFFGKQGHDWKRIDLFKKALQDRLANECETVRSLDDLQQFIATRANVIQFTPPRPMKVSSPEEDLAQLYTEIIGRPPSKPQRPSFKRVVAKSFSRAGLEKKIATDVRIRIPVRDAEIRIPFAFRNGRFNLINPVQFAGADPQKSFQRACLYAVEGRSIYEHPDPKFGQLQLVVVGEFRPNDEQSPTLVRNVLAENQVILYSAAELPRLIQEIKNTATDIDCILM